jgi:hypothetical protein
MAKRLRYVDAWYDEVFRVAPFRNLTGPVRVFFAGRLAPMKNPELLFKWGPLNSKVWGRRRSIADGCDASVASRRENSLAILARSS